MKSKKKRRRPTEDFQPLKEPFFGPRLHPAFLQRQAGEEAAAEAPAVAEPAETTATPTAEAAAPEAAPAARLSGADWESTYPEVDSVDRLTGSFRTGVQNFIAALEAGGASVRIGETYRAPERSYLMHYAWRIARESMDPQTVPAMAGVNINWWHGTLEASRAAAAAMVSAYNIVYRPALSSRHNLGLAIDMTISWTGDLTLNNASGTAVTISSTPRSGENADLGTVGASYGVRHLAGDPPHWSDNGH